MDNEEKDLVEKVEETKTEQASSPKKSSKNESSKKKDKSPSLLKAVKGEFKKIIWTPKDELFKQTITVIVVSLFFGLIIFGMDSLFTFGYSAIFELLTKV